MKELLLTLLAVYQTVNVRDNKPGAVLKTAGKLAEVGKLPLGSTIHTCTIAGEVYPKPSNLVSVLQDFMPDKPFKFTTKAGESYSATKAEYLAGLGEVLHGATSSVEAYDGRHTQDRFGVLIGAFQHNGLDWSELIEACPIVHGGEFPDYEIMHDKAVEMNASAADLVPTEARSKRRQGLRHFRAMEDRSKFTRPYLIDFLNVPGGQCQEIMDFVKLVVEMGLQEKEVIELGRLELLAVCGMVPDLKSAEAGKKRHKTKKEKVAVFNEIKAGNKSKVKKPTVLNKGKLQKVLDHAKSLENTQFEGILTAIIEGNFNGIMDMVTASAPELKDEAEDEDAETENTNEKVEAEAKA